ncbi:hypothetical protein Dfri01_29840 [Dyadobacter frigoris]|nr:hypothetical protein Dfri01_29840 [Dyadobacter frigoris]
MLPGTVDDGVVLPGTVAGCVIVPLDPAEPLGRVVPGTVVGVVLLGVDAGVVCANAADAPKTINVMIFNFIRFMISIILLLIKCN